MLSPSKMDKSPTSAINGTIEAILAISAKAIIMTWACST